MSDLTLRAATSDDVPAIVDLLKASLGQGAAPRTEAYWRWKHKANPFGVSPVLVAAAPDGQIVGVRAFMRWTWQHGAREVPAVRAVDTAVHPDWQGQGIFTRLTMQLVEDMEDEGVPFIFNTPNAQSRPGYLKMGWDLVGRVSLWVRPLRPGRCLKALALAAVSQHPTPATATLMDRFPPAAALPERLDRARLAPHGDAALVQYRTPRTAAYLRWRYAAIPGFDYRALWSDGDAEAALVFRERARFGLRELSISEVLAGPSAAARAAVRSLFQTLFRASKADYALVMDPRTASMRVTLLRAGFVPAPRLGPHLTVRTLNELPAGVPLTSHAAWDFSIGDLEVF